jgi:hypothetical protein
MPETKRVESPAPRISVALDRLTWAIRDTVKQVLATHGVVLYADQLGEVANNTAMAIVAEGEEMEATADHLAEIAQLKARVAQLEAAVAASEAQANKSRVGESRALADLMLAQQAGSRALNKQLTLESDIDRLHAEVETLRCQAITRDLRELRADIARTLAETNAAYEAMIERAAAIEEESAEYAALPETVHDRNAMLTAESLLDGEHEDLDDARYFADSNESLGLPSPAVWQ